MFIHISYDLVHFGHANSLRQVNPFQLQRQFIDLTSLDLSWLQAKNLGDYLIVGVHTDGTYDPLSVLLRACALYVLQKRLPIIRDLLFIQNRKGEV